MDSLLEDNNLLFSDNLLCVLDQLKYIQEWRQTYLLMNGQNGKIPFVGSCNGIADPVSVSKVIKENLGIADDWFQQNQKKNLFKLLRGIAEDNLILVILNNKNPYNSTVIDLEECRFVALSDSQAPLIYINSDNTEDSKLFFLLYGIVCIWLGIESLNDFSDYQEYITNKLEEFCQKIIIELLSLKNKKELILFLEAVRNEIKPSKRKLKIKEKYGDTFIESLSCAYKEQKINFSDISRILKNDRSRDFLK